MDRTLRLALNNFVAVPNSLRQDPAVNAARADIVVDLASLYHHYYLDCKRQCKHILDEYEFCFSTGVGQPRRLG